MRAFPQNTVRPYVLTKEGQFCSVLEGAGFDVLGCAGIAQFDNTRYSYYRGFRWLVLCRELVYLPITFIALLKARRRWGRFDLLHINDFTLIPVIWMAKKIFKCPIVVHVRSVQRPLDNLRGRIIYSLISKNVKQLIAIDQTVASSLHETLNCEVIHNGLSISTPDFSMLKSTLSSSDEVFTVGMVGGLSRAKGCLELIKAAKICRDREMRIRFVFVGQSMRKALPMRDLCLRLLGVSQEIYLEMLSLIRDYDLQSIVEFWPFTTELENVYSKLDLVCFPSHYNAPGRPIFEAALFGIPSVAAITNPTSDTIINEVTGLTIAPHSPRQLADAISLMYNDPIKLKTMGDSAKKLAQENFDVKKSAVKIVDIYRSLLKRSD